MNNMFLQRKFVSKLEVDLKPYIGMVNTEQNRKKIAKNISEDFSRVIAVTLQKDTDCQNRTTTPIYSTAYDGTKTILPINTLPDGE